MYNVEAASCALHLNKSHSLFIFDGVTAPSGEGDSLP